MKKLLLGLAFVSLIILSIFVSAILPNTYNPSDNSVTFNFEKAGWYLLPAGAAQSCDESVKAIWIWLPTLRKYVGTTSGPGSSEDGALINNEIKLGYLQEGFSGYWLYLSNPCTFKYNFPQSQNGDTLKLARRWNFLAVSPSYDGKSLNDLEGSCNIEKAYLWDTQNQKWGTISNLLDDKNVLRNEGGIGGGFIVKVSDDCKLGSSSGSSVTPPTLPSDVSGNNPAPTKGDRCVDSGDDFYLKDTVTIYKQNGQVYTNSDECTYDGRVQEQLCLDSEDYLGSKNFGAKYLQCPNGCNNGACIQ